VPNYAALENRKTELIRKALEGSVFIAPATAPAISSLTAYNATATAAKRVGTAAAVNIVTGGNLVLKIDALTPVTVALTAADAPSAVVTKINTALGATATAALNGSILEITSASTGAASQVAVVSGTGTVLSNLKLTVGSNAGSAAGISLANLPAGWDDLGWLTEDGAAFARDVSQDETTSYGSATPTRTDVTSDVTALTVVAQETKLLTIGLAPGADLAAAVPAANTGEVRIDKPSRPKGQHYRVLSVAVDLGDGGEIYLGRFLPRAKVSNFAEQAHNGGVVPWGVTLTGEEDSTLGYSESWLFGGPGWNYLLQQMGFAA
jgi:hypothetical protein